MPAAPPPSNEHQRLQSLRALNILDTVPEDRFDRLTRVARRLFDVPIALLSFVDADRQWFKSRVGVNAEQTPRDASFCAHAILVDEIMVVRDAAADERFMQNPLVLNEPGIRFYAGCPVKAPDGSALGTLCVIGHEPRDVQEDDAELLRDLAEMAEQELRALFLATIDELTGLTNRRGFHTIATHVLALCRRVDRPATLLLFDLNEFKQINDTLGHAEGDRVLQGFAEDLVATFRDSDVVTRLGGDEFCVLLSGSRKQDVHRPLALLEERLKARAANGDSEVRFSVGAAAYDPAVHKTIADLSESADVEMYKQKRENNLTR